jgi:YHS domain-containing protein
MIKSTLILALLSTFAVTALAAPAELKCPVTKFKIAKKENAVGKKAYKGKTYYFCTSHCQSLFGKNPKKYAK